MIAGVRIVGTEAVDARVCPDMAFEPCPFAHKLGIPLVVKREPPTNTKHEFYRVVRIMTDPEIGLAAWEWQYGGMCVPAPPVVMARADGKPFGVAELTALEDFLERLFDDDDFPVSLRAASPSDFWQFVSEQAVPCSNAFLDLRFPKGLQVQAKDLQLVELNGTIGTTTGEYTSGRVGVLFPEPFGPKAVRPQHLSAIRGSRAAVRSVEPSSEKRAGFSLAWMEVGCLWQLPGLVVENAYPLVGHEFGIRFQQMDEADGCESIMPLRISAGTAGGLVLLPTGGVLGCDWWRGRKGSLPQVVYVLRDGAQVIRFDSLTGFLCYGDDQPESMSEPQAPCHACRVKLLVRRLEQPWQRVGTVADLSKFLKSHPTESHRYAVEWAVDGCGFKRDGAIALVPREVLIRKQGGKSLQVSPADGETAWEATKATPTRVPALSDDMPDLFDWENIHQETTVVLGRECFVHDIDHEYSPNYQWYFCRRQHGLREHKVVPSPAFATASVYVRAC